MNQDAHAESLAGAGEMESRGHMFVVADGMGAHAAGELASQLAVREVETRYRAVSDLNAQEALVEALKVANSVIHERGQRDSELYNMGTTCSALVIVPDGAITAHAGDSRVYRCRNGMIQQLTFDHSLVWEMRAAGQHAPSSRDSMIPRNVITRCLGPHADVEVDVEGPFSIQPGDVFLLCSDGLTGRVSDSEIGAIASSLPPEVAVQFLVDLANLRGGSDNITVVIAEITDESLSASGKVSEFRPSPNRAGTHAAWWFGAATGLLTVMAGLMLNLNAIAVLGAVLFLVSAIAAGFQWLRQEDRTEAQNVAPYVSAEASVNRAFVNSTLDTLEISLESVSPAVDGLDAEIQQLRKLSDGDQQACCRDLASTARRLAEHLPGDLGDAENVLD